MVDICLDFCFLEEIFLGPSSIEKLDLIAVGFVIYTYVLIAEA